LFEAIGPVALAAQHADHHQPGLGRGLVEIEVYRHRVGQVHQRCEAEIRGVAA
jgi:hypothetical protein